MLLAGFGLGLVLMQGAFFYLAHRAGHRKGHLEGEYAERRRSMADREHFGKVLAIKRGELQTMQQELDAARAALAWGPYRRLEKRAN